MVMEQLLLHLLGDYVTQTDWMATKKASDNLAAFLHATVYALPFLFIGSLQAVAVILASHFMVDRFSLARYVCFAKNWTTRPSLTWAEAHLTGYPRETPVWMATGLLIVVDNFIHLLSNYAALGWL